MGTELVNYEDTKKLSITKNGGVIGVLATDDYAITVIFDRFQPSDENEIDKTPNKFRIANAVLYFIANTLFYQTEFEEYVNLEVHINTELAEESLPCRYNDLTNFGSRSVGCFVQEGTQANITSVLLYWRGEDGLERFSNILTRELGRIDYALRKQDLRLLYPNYASVLKARGAPIEAFSVQYAIAHSHKLFTIISMRKDNILPIPTEWDSFRLINWFDAEAPYKDELSNLSKKSKKSKEQKSSNWSLRIGSLVCLVLVVTVFYSAINFVPMVYNGAIEDYAKFNSMDRKVNKLYYQQAGVVSLQEQMENLNVTVTKFKTFYSAALDESVKKKEEYRTKYVELRDRTRLLPYYEKWPGDNIYYYIDPMFSEAGARLINLVFSHYDKNIECLTFTSISSETMHNLSEDEFIYMKMVDDPDGRSYSGIGVYRNMPNAVSITQSVVSDAKKFYASDAVFIEQNKWKIYVIAHELGHKLGLAHEHQREDANLSILYKNVEAGLVDQLTALPKTHYLYSLDKHIFEPESLMAYEPWIGSTNGNKTIDYGREVNRGFLPTMVDIIKLRSIYCGKEPPPKDVQWRISLMERNGYDPRTAILVLSEIEDDGNTKNTQIIGPQQ